MKAPAKIRRGEGGHFIGDPSKPAARRRRRREEESIQKAFARWCRFSLRDNVLWHSIPNEGRRPVSQLMNLIAMGLTPGAADFAIIHDGRLFYIEFKAASGLQAAQQAEFERRARNAGAAYAVARSCEEAVALLDGWGIPHREVRR